MKLEFEGSPLEYAQSLPVAELKKVIKGIKKGKYDEFSDRCRICFERYLEGRMETARWWSRHAESVR